MNKKRKKRLLRLCIELPAFGTRMVKDKTRQWNEKRRLGILRYYGLDFL